MSQMLKDALVDATALKEAAVKNAESILTEKYADKIREAVDSLLEQEDEEMVEDDFSDDLVDGMDDTGLSSEITDEVPLAATDGEKLCPCPEEEEVIEIDFDELERQMSDEDGDSFDMQDREELADELVEPEEEDLLENFDITEEQLDSLVEELKVDLESVPNGYQGANKMERERDMDIALAKAASDTAVKEEYSETKQNLEDIESAEIEPSDDAANEKEEFMASLLDAVRGMVEKEAGELKEKIKHLEEQNKSLNEELSATKEKENKIVQENRKYKNYLSKISEKLSQLNLVNSKLLYKNRVLEDRSLNTRQKTQIAEAISKAGSVEETKALYEALQSGVGSSVESTKPESLSEAVKPMGSSVVLGRRDQVKPDPSRDRMLRLAGIKNKR